MAYEEAAQYAKTREAFGKPSGPYAGYEMTAETIKQSPAYQVLTPDQALELAENLGQHSVIYLNPLLAGIDPGGSIMRMQWG